MLFKDNKLQYALEDTVISNQFISNSLLRVRHNSKLYDYLKKNLNIEIIGDIEFNFIFLLVPNLKFLLEG